MHEFKTRKELAADLGISTRTLYRYMEKREIQINHRTLLNANEYESIKSQLKGRS